MTVSVDTVAEFLVVSDVGVEAECAAIMDELVSLAATGCGISDPAVSLDAASNVMSVELTAVGESFDAAVELADSCARTAIHAAGVATPRWEPPVQRSRRADLADA